MFIARVYVLFIMKVKIIFLIKRPYMYVSPCMLTMELRIVNQLWARSPISLEHKDFLAFVLRSTHDHPSLKYKCLFKMGNQIKHTYLTYYNPLITLYPHCKEKATPRTKTLVTNKPNQQQQNTINKRSNSPLPSLSFGEKQIIKFSNVWS